MTFGKRQSGVGATAQSFNVDMTAARSQVSSQVASQAATEAAAAEDAPVKGSPIRWAIVMLACGAMLYGFLVNYGPDLRRDRRLAGTWQPAYDLKATEGRCKRTNFVITSCSAKIASIAQPDQALINIDFFMLFSGGGGEALVPVRSTVDRAAVSIYYAAETKLWNRTLSFVFGAVILALMTVAAALTFWKSLNH
ncbi:hypothetical protein SSBR45G_39240 [Bradyrhizobium sp. SSBR45G]|uniref:hypothetical protein n=1 Tax=unclassified Bradyrhizobium TaxID=2631580 RepID=UPI002342B479|nr:MULTISPECIES: hypothetical protein [unclassified Bradyrhizobium]GLH79015.1 hypothetical protein SSBR45G_39240 [Bradyrhizobium sp. SSBR45G]GLH85337.1 hypothetical protein SSBR45R_27970 [Bradyrhizobium sp. SSBR45R]